MPPFICCHFFLLHAACSPGRATKINANGLSGWSHSLAASFQTFPASQGFVFLSSLISHCVSEENIRPRRCRVMVHFQRWSNDVSLCVCTFSDGEDWFCECPPLHTGRRCQLNACERNPCGHGATCIPKSPLEAACLCPYGRQGLLCDECECESASQIIEA